MVFVALIVFTPPTAVAVAFVGTAPTQRRHGQRLIKSTTTTTTTTTTTAVYATDAVTVCKDELLSLVQGAPSGRATPKRMTTQILDIVRQLERKCPTPNDQVLSALAGSWELLWTAQDPESPEIANNRGTGRAFRSWILNPIENQAYSNNPEGRSNPFLPIALQNRLEKAGWVSSTPVRSTQAIDLKSGLIRNIVAVNIGGGGRRGLHSSMTTTAPSQTSSPSPRRASLTVTVKFTAVLSDPRRVNVKFDACRISIPGTPIEWTFPLGLAGPTGWLRTVYIDDNLCVARGHKGSVFVLSRPRRAAV